MLGIYFLCQRQICFAAQIIGVEEDEQVIISEQGENEGNQHPQVPSSTQSETQLIHSNQKKSSANAHSKSVQSDESKIDSVSNNTVEEIVSENNIKPKTITYRIRHYVQDKQGGSFSLFLEEYAEGENGKLIAAPVCKKAIDYVNQSEGMKCAIPIQRKVRLEQNLIVSYYYSCVANGKIQKSEKKNDVDSTVVLKGEKETYVLKKLASDYYELEKIEPMTRKKLVVPERIQVDEKIYRIESIGKSFLEGNMCVCQVVLPSSIKTIEERAFYDCKELKRVKIKSHILEAVGENAFAGCHRKIRFDVPAGYISNYQFLLCEKQEE